ncbi:CIN8 [Candida pseudojiufengensis]|uniref:CIN8 n=1 Tax=Candida pseudojiufengensis TaxID=497109 RepID=UPI0022257096|nr:CIN8 [Candida pseudojiufengensis]KAI5962360.1 CIN8 [Candida pseudojiufengensis]
MSNIQVVVRCRGRNTQEIEAKSPIVVEMADDNFSSAEPFVTINNLSTSTSNTNIRRSSSSFNKSINNQLDVTHPSVNSANKKTFKFDEIYGSQADQILLYSNVALPLLRDFIDGINVTILAYGQTGTGKTYTMCGLNDTNIDLTPVPEIAGIIPRLLSQLFQILNNEALDSDYIVKMSFLEIYNEELVDLLSHQNKKLRIHEQVNPTTKSSPNANNITSKSISIQNLSEFTVSSYEESIKLLRLGLDKKKMASTNLNEHSSRSHTIFGIQLFKKHPKNDSVYLCSKMNLVDLAGSENIGRSGSVVKEAGGINQSLLTLGRVINSLNDKKKSQHIPYRESKLTHILQDSLGGNTKTVLIATISPAQINASETTSTLDYAAKAKNIKNLPQNGNDSEVLLKKTLVKQLSKEIGQLHMDLIATRNKNGVYLNPDNYDRLIKENESSKTELKENSLKLESLTKKFESTKSNLELSKIENSNLQDENVKLKQKLEELEAEHQQDLQSNTRKDMMIDSLNGKLNQISQKSSNSAVLLMNLFSNHLSSSIDLINDSLNIQSTSAVSKRLDDLQNELQLDVQTYTNNLKLKLQSHQNDFKNNAVEDLGQMISSVEDMLNDLTKLQKTMQINMNEAFTDLRIANEKLSGFLKDDNLTTVRDKITEKQNEMLKVNLKMLYGNIKVNVNNEIEKCLKNASLNSMNIIQDIVHKERANVMSYEENWKNQVEKILPSIEKEFNDYHQISKSNFDQVKQINEIGSSKLETMKHAELDIGSDELPDVSKISQISKNLILDQHLITNNLKEVNDNLTKIQEFDAKKEFSVSPTRSMVSNLNQNMQTNNEILIRSKRSLSLSPQKSQNSTLIAPLDTITSNNLRMKSPSKIPKFKRSETNITNYQQNKKRKVFHPLENNSL